MRRQFLVATCASVLLVLCAGVATAKDNVALRGSDTLEQVTIDVLAACPAAVAKGITYLGGGSSTGGNAMMLGAQTVSPQSRPLSSTEGCTASETSEGLVIGLDGLSILAGATNANACGGGLAFSTTKTIPVTTTAGAPAIDCTGCDADTNNYRLTDWRDVLALVYGGVHHTPVKNCASDVRRSLVANWANLFEGACPAGTCAGGLRRAYRRGDLSGTTDTFAALVGLGSMPLAKNVPGATAKVVDFCNAFGAGAIFGGDSDFLDNDPIRLKCEPNDQVCGRMGNLGLVTTIEVPANLTAAANYPTRLCGVGQFRFLTTAIFNGPGICANGMQALFNHCWQPVLVNPEIPGGFTSDCLARRFPVQGFQPNGMDGRAYNLYPRMPDGLYRRDSLGRFITGAYYRVHSTATIAAGASTCRFNSATDQIGCLSQANPCSIGFAGREGTSVVPGIVGLRVNGLEPTRANIENLVLTASTADDYPLSRKLYFNTIQGFENPLRQTGEYELAKCMGRSSLVNTVMTNRGFVPVPGGVVCEDFRGDSCATGTGPSAVNACTNNPADLLSL